MGRAGRRARARGWPHGGEGSRGGGHGAVSTLRPPSSVRVKKKKRRKAKCILQNAEGKTAYCKRQKTQKAKCKNAERIWSNAKRRTRNAKCKKNPTKTKTKKHRKKSPENDRIGQNTKGAPGLAPSQGPPRVPTPAGGRRRQPSGAQGGTRLWGAGDPNRAPGPRSPRPQCSPTGRPWGGIPGPRVAERGRLASPDFTGCRNIFLMNHLRLF